MFILEVEPLLKNKPSTFLPLVKGEQFVQLISSLVTELYSRPGSIPPPFTILATTLVFVTNMLYVDFE